jgi:hypothetical protein
MIAVALCLPSRADAGAVYGRVYVEERPGKPAPVRNAKLQVMRPRGPSVETDGDGRYSIVLDPGIYCVEDPARGLKAVIQSHPRPIHQDMYLTKGRC